MLLYFSPRKNSYVANTKRIVYALLSECQEKRTENKDKTLLEFAALFF